MFIEIDHCFENNQCGIHGICKNAEGTFQCECTFLYDGIYCDKCMQEFIIEINLQKSVYFWIIDSSEAIQVIAASLFIALACFAICLCKRTQNYKNNRRRRQIQKRNKHK